MFKNLLKIAYIFLFLSCTDSNEDFKLHQVQGDDINLLFTYEDRSLKTIMDSLTGKSIKIDSFESNRYRFDNTGKIILSKYAPLNEESVYTYDGNNRIKSIEEKRFAKNNELFTKKVYNFKYKDALLTDIDISVQSFSSYVSGYSENIKILYDDEDFNNVYVRSFVFDEVFQHMRTPFYLLSEGELPNKRIRSTLIVNSEMPTHQKDFLYNTDVNGNILKISIKEGSNSTSLREYWFKYN